MSTVRLVALDRDDAEWLIGYLGPIGANNPTAARIKAQLESSEATEGAAPRWARTDLPDAPKPGTDLLTVLRDTALKYQELATKVEPGPSRAACSIVSNALLDVWHALMTAQVEGKPE